MALTKEQRALRENHLTASQVGILMGDDANKILNLWKLQIGDPSYAEPDLNDVWAVRLGEATEELNLSWYAKKHGSVARIGEFMEGDPSWMGCTLDGWDINRKCPVECKHVSGREPIEVIAARYTPQTSWQCLCTKAKECALSVIMGANEPIVEFLPLDNAYADELMRRSRAFWDCVESLTPPVVLPKVEAPPLPVKDYDMTADTGWKVLAARWVQSYGAAQTAKECEAEIKKLVPQDAQKAWGHGIIVSRDRAGRMSLREMKSESTR